MSALVRTSRTFPSTTTCADTAGDVPALEAEKSLSTSRSVKDTDSLPVPAITQTPTSVGLSNTAAVSPVAFVALASRNASAPAATRAGFTTTVMPSAITLVGDGCTRIADVKVMPSAVSRSRTEFDVVDMVWCSPSTTRVTCLRRERFTTPATSTMPTTTVAPMTARWVRSRRTLVARIGNLPPGL